MRKKRKANINILTIENNTINTKKKKSFSRQQ